MSHNVNKKKTKLNEKSNHSFLDQFENMKLKRLTHTPHLHSVLIRSLLLHTTMNESSIQKKRKITNRKNNEKLSNEITEERGHLNKLHFYVHFLDLMKKRIHCNFPI